MAYLTVENVGLRVMDVRDPRQPRPMGTWWNASGEIWELKVQTGYAYIAQGSLGLQIVDVRDPAQPRQVGHVTMPDRELEENKTEAHRVALTPTHAYVFYSDLYSSELLAVFDLADPTRPSLVNIVEEAEFLGAPYSTAVAGNRLYAILQYRILVLDIADPVAPEIVGQFDGSPDCYAVEIVVDVAQAYVTCSSDGQHLGLAIFDVSDPAAIQQIGFAETGTWIDGLVVHNQRAYVTETVQKRRTGIRMVEVSNPAQPSLALNPLNLIGSVADMANVGSTVIAVADQGRLWSWQIDSSGRAETLIPFDFPWSAQTLVATGDLVLVIAGKDGLRILDAADPPFLRELGASVPRPDSGLTDSAVVSDRSRAYVLTSRQVDREHRAAELRVIDIQNPRQPREIGSVAVDEGAARLALDGRHVVVVGARREHHVLQVVDISDPTQPHLLGQLGLPDPARDLAVGADHLVFVSTLGMLHIVDVTDPAQPREIALHPFLGEPFGLAIRDSRAYVVVSYPGRGPAGHGYSLRMLDLADPQNGREITRVELPGTDNNNAYGWPNRVLLAGDRVMVAGRWVGLHVITEGRLSPTPVYLPWASRR